MQTVTAMLLYYTNAKHCDILQFYEVCIIFLLFFVVIMIYD